MELDPHELIDQLRLERDDALAEVERLRAEVERLREALDAFGKGARASRAALTPKPGRVNLTGAPRKAPDH